MRYLLGWSARQGAGGERHEEKPMGGNPFAGLRLVLTSPYLGGIAAFVFLMAAVSTFLYLQQADLLGIHFPDSSERTTFLGRIELTMSVITLALQLLAVGRLTRRVGVAAMIVVVPLFVVAGFLLIAASPTLMTLVGVFIARARRPVRDRAALPRDALHDGGPRVEVQGEERQRHARVPDQRLRRREGPRRDHRDLVDERRRHRAGGSGGCGRLGGGRVAARPCA